MSLLKELPDKGATTAWSPVASHPNLMVLGTKDGGGGFEDYGGELEVHRFDFGEYQEKGSAVLGSFKTPTRFSSIAWSQMSNKSAEYPLGLIAGGMADGVVNVWDPAKLVANHPQPQMSTVHRHQGAVNDLQFNHHPESSHLLATGGADAEVFIMSMDRPDTPNVFVPAPDSNAKHLGEVTKVAWNSQVAHILATAGQNGSCIVWDLRQKKPWCELKDTIRGRIADVAWNPDQGLHIVTASGDDNNPVINLWDLRGNYTVPSATLRGHTQGILSLAWCKKDTSLILSCGKDNRTLMWDLYKGESVYELPATQDGGAAAAAGAPPASVFGTIGGASGRRYELAWSPHVPTLVSACSFDRKVQVFSMGSAANKSGRAPRWMARPAGASFGFGGKLLSFGAPGADGKRKLQVRRVVENLELVAASKRFEDAMASKDFRAYCVQKIEGAQEPYEKKVWQFMQVIFEKNAREQLLTHLGFNPERIAELADKYVQDPAAGVLSAPRSQQAAPGAPAPAQGASAQELFGGGGGAAAAPNQAAAVAASSPEMEFAAILRMRTSDIYSAMYRALAFARRVWSDPGINLRWDMAGIRKLRIIEQLTRWLFDAVCWRLVPHVPHTEEIEKCIEEGREKVLQGKHMQSTATLQKRRAEYVQTQPVAWKRRGLLSPADRRQEKEFQAKIKAWLEEAERMREEGQMLIDQGKFTTERALAQLPQLDQSPENIAYYSEKLKVAKTQLQLEASLGAGVFRDGLQALGGGGGGGGGRKMPGALEGEVFGTVTRALRKRLLDEARERASQENSTAGDGASTVSAEELLRDLERLRQGTAGRVGTAADGRRPGSQQRGRAAGKGGGGTTRGHTNNKRRPTTADSEYSLPEIV